jgi:hypothetical protein
MVAVNEGQWRLIFRQAQPGRAELYDIYSDPLEQHELSKEAPPGVLSRMKGYARAYFNRAPAPWGERVDVELDEAQLEELRALGYDVGGQ